MTITRESGVVVAESENAKDFLHNICRRYFLRTEMPDPKGAIFRGQGKAEWDLIPAIVRENSEEMLLWYANTSLGNPEEVLDDEDIEVLELAILYRFLNYAYDQGLDLPGITSEMINVAIKMSNEIPTYTSAKYIKEDYYEYTQTLHNENTIKLMAYVQHAKLPTRLLDWTKSSEIAAFFAARGAITEMSLFWESVKGKDADTEKRKKFMESNKIAVWCIDRYRLEDKQVLSPPLLFNDNLRIQKGLFTLSGSTITEIRNPLNRQVIKAGNRITKFTLSYQHVSNLLKMLYNEGISTATLFRGDEGIRNAMNESYDMYTYSPFSLNCMRMFRNARRKGSSRKK